MTNVQNSGLLSGAGGSASSWTPGTAPTLNNLLTCRNWGYQNFIGGAADSSGTPKNFNVSDNQSVGGNGGVGIFHLVVPSGLTTPLVETSPSNGSHYTFFDEWTGNDPSNAFDTSNSGTASTGSADTGTINTGTNAGLALACYVQIFGPGGSNTGTNFTDDGTQSGTFSGAVASRTTACAGQTGLHDTWSTSGGNAWGAVVASFNALPLADDYAFVGEPQTGSSPIQGGLR
jgi:hypothetical protein